VKENSEETVHPGSENKKKESTWYYLKALLTYIKPYWKKQLAALFFLLVGTGLSLLIPLLVKELMDVALPEKDHDLLVELVLLMVGLEMLNMVFMFLTNYLFIDVSNAFVHDLRRNMHNKLLDLSMNFFNKTKSGQSMARVMGDVDAIQELATDSFLMFLTDTFSVLLMLGVMLYLSWEMTLVGAGAIIILVLVNKGLNFKLAAAARRSREDYASISEELQESIAGIREVKAFGFETGRQAKFDRNLKSYRKNNIRVGLLGSVSQQSSLLVIGLGPIAVYYFGGLGIFEGNCTIGTLVAFIVYLGYMYMSAQRLSMLNIQIQSSMGALQRVFEVLNSEPIVKERVYAKTLPDTGAEIHFENVSFAYQNDSTDVIKNINLRIKTGERIALVGASGAGKSTLAALIYRFYDVRQGSLKINGCDLRDLSISSLRAAISMVPQETFLFHASIEDNMKIAKAFAQDSEIRNALEMANAAGFVDKLSKGCKSWVGERGAKLSGGQKQRLSIARAILKDPGIVIFDEATSSLDAESENLVKSSMRKLMKGRTTIVISHHLASLSDVERIVVMDKGSIVEEGTYQDLIKKDGVFCRLYRQQSK
jgi:subfamily B ATP-binding cassette protein MsbA